MVSGRRAFQRDTAVETMTAVLKDEPPDIELAVPLPPGLDRIIRHCLEKNPAERFQSARDVAFAIAALSGTSTAKTEAVSDKKRTSRGWLWPAIAAAALLIGAPAGFVAGRRGMGGSPAVGASISAQIKTFDPMFISNARFMPDGESLVFSAAQAGNVPACTSAARTRRRRSRSASLPRICCRYRRPASSPC